MNLHVNFSFIQSQTSIIQYHLQNCCRGRTRESIIILQEPSSKVVLVLQNQEPFSKAVLVVQNREPSSKAVLVVQNYGPPHLQKVADFLTNRTSSPPKSPDKEDDHDSSTDMEEPLQFRLILRFRNRTITGHILILTHYRT
ncbi:hypothetical protein O6P43_004503 [Quillaja saponaria]|uniref:Uncharacterized protein n=1 Tax=Quillaja saponaria TaxID=32244 RepID=A0AAD7Q477_QUISA|nr:hypothetical protein O6P43_004503 [Quillaja saponaria]